MSMSEVNEDDGGDDYVDTTYKDVNELKTACLNFARNRIDILKSLSREDIQTVVGRGCPNLFRKAVNSAKRLRAFVKLDEGNVCASCNLRGSCDRAYALLKEHGLDTAARTVDIVRLLLTYALDPLFVSGGEKLHGREQVEVSVRKLLLEVVELSEKAPDPVLPKPAIKPAIRKEQSEKVRDRQPSQGIGNEEENVLVKKSLEKRSNPEDVVIARDEVLSDIGYLKSRIKKDWSDSVRRGDAGESF